MPPLVSESRMAAQLAPLLIVDSMPYFLNSPFSCAITRGEQSVRAIMPKLSFGVSGPSVATVPGATLLGATGSAADDVALLAGPPHPAASSVPAAPAAARNRRRVTPRMAAPRKSELS